MSAKYSITRAFTDNWCETHVNVVETSFTWTINNFSFCSEKPGEALESTVFSATSYDVLKWRMLFYPCGNNEDNKDYVSLFLHLVACDKPSIKADFTFCILDKEGREVNERKTTEKWQFFQGRQSGFTKFVKKDYVLDQSNGFLFKDKLRIVCKIKSATGVVDRISQEPRAPDLLGQLSKELERLLDAEENFSDVILEIGDEVKFRAHKSILASRSSVFAAMFEHNMKERRENVVHIFDLEPGTFKAMLKYMYSGKVSIDGGEGTASKLLGAADKYALEGLKVTCEQSLCKSLTVEDAIEYLLVADLHSATRLKTESLAFIKAHLKQVIETASFKALSKTQPRLLEEILRFMTKS